MVSVSLVVAGMMMASMAASPAWAVLLAKAAYWRMNDTPGPMIDSSPNHNNGTPRGVVRTGSSYGFNGSTSHVAVPDDASLDPGGKNITLRASVMVKGSSLDDDSYDVVRKGLYTTQGGYYKMEIKRTSDPAVGKLHCLFKGSGGTTVSKVAHPDIVDGDWHTLTCAKRSDSVVARVDGRSYTRTGSAGTISNSSKVRVGAKMTNPLDDMFHGRMNFVSIYIAR